ncbi:Ima1 N-terminal domain-containing protein [Kalaharituber pfeilii]|nr:Ima1 N-terminal domain-containing protein [Kalaharituber pfeilii]
MSVFGRRRKLVCFFCGHSQSIVTADPVRKFTCTSPYCQSVNHLDEQGNIVDYVPSPQSAPAQPVRYARSVRSPSPAVEASGSAVGSASPIFCRSCEKNLAIKRNILADYLPPEDDPEYEIYCAKLPDFKRSLEEKYPEPCATCALKAEQKIKEANYQAKAAMIGRLLERSQNMKPAYRQEPWGLSRALKLGFWLLRGTGWIGTHLLVIAWHGTTLLYPIPITEQKDITGTWATCVEKTWQERRVSMACYESSAWSIQKFIPWSWLFLFWNYQALAQTRHPKAKLTGLWEFIKCEFILFFIRWAAWFVLSPGRVKTDISIEAFQAMNFGFLALSIIGFVYAMTTLRIVEPARINLRESVSPLANSPDQSPPREKQKSALTPLPRERQYPHHSWLPPSTASTVKSNFPPFKAEPLMPAASTFSRASSLPPLSPQPLRSDAAGDEMDWNPTTPAKKALGWGQLSVNNTNQLNSQSIFRSNSSNQPQQQNVNSPFSAPIPPAPRTSLYQQFVTKPPIKKEPAAEPQRENFFRPSTSDGRSTGPTTLNGSAKQYPPLAEARFFPKKVDDEDTGLEGLISGALKLEDEPEVIRNARVTKATSGTDLQLDVLVRLVLTLLAFLRIHFHRSFHSCRKVTSNP